MFNFLNLISIYDYGDERHNVLNLFGIKLKFSNIDLKKIHKNYRIVEKKVAEKYKNGKINITFLVSIISMFPAKPLVDFLLKSDKYNVKIIHTIRGVGYFAKDED